MSYNGTINNYVKFSKKIGGVRKAYEGHNLPWMYYGGFKFPSLDVLPASGNVLPAFTPVKVDEVARTIVPLYIFKVKAVDATNSKVQVYKDVEGTRAKVGMPLILVGNNLSQAATNVATVTAIDSSNTDYDVLTLSASPATSGTAWWAAGDYLAEADSATSKKVKVVPNGLTPYDTCVDEDAYALDGDAVWGADAPILERRIVPIPDSIKAALKAADCVFKFSNRK